jgi:hypothetical protein
MSVRVILGEPYCRTAGSREVHLELAEGESLPLSEVCARLSLPNFAANMEESPLFVLNDRVLSHAQAARAMVRSGDRLIVQLMLGGG